MAPRDPDQRARAERATPQGGMIGPRGRVRRWRWSDDGSVCSVPVRCGGDQSYLVRASTRNGEPCELVCHFLLRSGESAWQRVGIGAGDGCHDGRLACVTTPDHCTHLSIAVPREMAGALASVQFWKADEPPTESHPLANVPRWSEYARPIVPRRVIVPAGLECIGEHVRGPAVEVDPRSAARVAAWRGCAVVLGAEEVRRLAMGWAGLRRRAAGSIVLVSLDALGALLARGMFAGGVEGETAAENTAGGGCATSAGGGCATSGGDCATTTAVDGRVRRRRAREVRSCVVEYAGWATRGFALQDAVPCCAAGGGGRFVASAWSGGRGWRRFAEEQGIIRLLSLRPDGSSRAAVSLACPLESGAIIASDLPWLLARGLGEPVAAGNIGRMVNAHLGGEVAEETQYWSVSESVTRVVRDVAELCRRYEPLRAIRWATTADEPLALGVTLGMGADTTGRTVLRGKAGAGGHVVLRTGRIDLPSELGGVPAEAMMIVMKQLARRVRDGTIGWRRVQRVTWQFEAAAGQLHAHLYASAEGVGVDAGARVISVGGAGADGPKDVRLGARLGPFADGSHQVVEELLGIVGTAISNSE